MSQQGLAVMVKEVKKAKEGNTNSKTAKGKGEYGMIRA